ncbi:MAG: hypothetical protein WC811_14510 [Hyphomicrobium sp.]
MRAILKRLPFITPMSPRLVASPPLGSEWLHEIKFDGFRAQAHVDHGDVAVFSKAGKNLTRRFRRLPAMVQKLPASQVIIDVELIVCDEAGLLDFTALLRSGAERNLCQCCFDLLSIDGVSLTEKPLDDRRERLRKLLQGLPERELVFSMAFDDPIKLLAAAEEQKIEGLVSKKRASLYRSGPIRDGLKIKTDAWRMASRGRFKGR